MHGAAQQTFPRPLRPKVLIPLGDPVGRATGVLLSSCRARHSGTKLWRIARLLFFRQRGRRCEGRDRQSSKVAGEVWPVRRKGLYFELVTPFELMEVSP